MHGISPPPLKKIADGPVHFFGGPPRFTADPIVEVRALRTGITGNFFFPAGQNGLGNVFKCVCARA